MASTSPAGTRLTFLQKNADAAATAGVVWMPNLSKATQVATDTLAYNGIVSGVDDVCVDHLRGLHPDVAARHRERSQRERYFSTMISGNQQLTRSAEAEYFVPLPLGSPLNYFGGDRSKTQLPDTTVYQVDWPTPAGSASRPTVGPTFPCNVGTSSAQALGRWTSATVYDAAGYTTGAAQCQWTVVGPAGAGTTSVPPPDYTTRTPVTQPCRVRPDGISTSTVLGRWNANVYTPGTTGTDAMCTFTDYTTTSSTVPSFSGTTAPPEPAVQRRLRVRLRALADDRRVRAVGDLHGGGHRGQPAVSLERARSPRPSSRAPTRSPPPATLASGRRWKGRARSPPTGTRSPRSARRRCPARHRRAISTATPATGTSSRCRRPARAQTTISIFDALFRRDGCDHRRDRRLHPRLDEHDDQPDLHHRVPRVQADESARHQRAHAGQVPRRAPTRPTTPAGGTSRRRPRSTCSGGRCARSPRRTVRPIS